MSLGHGCPLAKGLAGAEGARLLRASSGRFPRRVPGGAQGWPAEVKPTEPGAAFGFLPTGAVRLVWRLHPYYESQGPRGARNRFEISVDSCWATVEAGVLYGTLRAAAPLGLKCRA